MPSPCPGEDCWKRLADGALDGPELDQLWRHLAQCRVCRRIAGGLVRAAAWEAALSETAAEGPRLPTAFVQDAFGGGGAARDGERRFRDALQAVLRAPGRSAEAAALHTDVMLHPQAEPPWTGTRLPALAAEGESDTWMLSADLPAYSSGDRRVTVRLRREPETRRLLAYLIGEAPAFGRWYSLTIEPDGPEMITDERGVCELPDLDSETLRRVRLRVRAPRLRFVPQGDPRLTAARVRAGEELVLEPSVGAVGSAAEVPGVADNIVSGPVILRPTAQEGEESAGIEVDLPPTLRVPGDGRPTTLALVTDRGILQAAWGAGAGERPTLRPVSLPATVRELRLFSGDEGC